MNQTVKNMEEVVLKLQQTIFTEMFTGEYKHETTQVVKTLINTYQTMLNTFLHMTDEEFKKANVKYHLENQAENIYKLIKTIESVNIPKLMELKEYKGVDNLSLVVEKGRKIIRNINPNRDYTKEKVQFNAHETTKELLDKSIETGTLIHQYSELLRGTGKTVSIIKKAYELDCAILTMNEVSMNYTNKLAKEMNLNAVVIPSSGWRAISFPQYRKQVKNGLLIDDVRYLEVLDKLREKGYKILGGFTA